MLAPGHMHCNAGTANFGAVLESENMNQNFYKLYAGGSGAHIVAAENSNNRLHLMSSLCEQESENIMKNFSRSSKEEDSQSSSFSDKIQTNTVHV